MTILLELPEDLAADFRFLSEADRNRYALALLRAGKEAEHAGAAIPDEDLPPTSAEDLAAIGRGLADADAERLLAAEDFFAHLDARAAARQQAGT